MPYRRSKHGALLIESRNRRVNRKKAFHVVLVT